jgi:large subunit ribosomal protein L15
MKLGDLHHAPGATSTKKRRGKGRATGVGGTSGRGNKGVGSRSGGRVHRWFEGGQMPIQRRLPKRGFRRPQKIVFQIVDVGQVAELKVDLVNRELLIKHGLVRKNGGPIKLLADGEIQAAIKILVDASSRAAKAKIESAGGAIEKPGK